MIEKTEKKEVSFTKVLSADRLSRPINWLLLTCRPLYRWRHFFFRPRTSQSHIQQVGATSLEWIRFPHIVDTQVNCIKELLYRNLILLTLLSLFYVIMYNNESCFHQHKRKTIARERESSWCCVRRRRRHRGSLCAVLHLLLFAGVESTDRLKATAVLSFQRVYIAG